MSDELCFCPDDDVRTRTAVLCNTVKLSWFPWRLRVWSCDLRLSSCEGTLSYWLTHTPAAQINIQSSGSIQVCSLYLLPLSINKFSFNNRLWFYHKYYSTHEPQQPLQWRHFHPVTSELYHVSYSERKTVVKSSMTSNQTDNKKHLI